MNIEFGTHYLLTIREEERLRVRSFYESLLGCNLLSHDMGATTNIPPDIDLFHFPDGIVLGVRYVDNGEPVLDTEQHKLGCWMELATDDEQLLIDKLREFGVEEITDFWDKDHFYFHAPGGQVYRVVDFGVAETSGLKVAVG